MSTELKNRQKASKHLRSNDESTALASAANDCSTVLSDNGTELRPYYEDSQSIIFHGDSLILLSKLSNTLMGRVELTVTDPPYNFTTASAGAGKLNPWADLCNSAYWFAAWIKLCFDKFDKTKVNSALWIFHNWRTTVTIHKAIFDLGRQVESQLIWDKNWIGPGGKRGLRPSYECVSLVCEDKFALKDRGLYDIKKSSWSSIKPNGHPAEKPVELLRWLIRISGKQVILDPFMGVGTTLLAAKQLNRKSIGIEIEEKYCEIAAKRLSQEVLDFTTGAVEQ